MEPQLSKRAQETRERLRAAAYRLFLQQGYMATSVEAILAEAGIASKETLYRHYANKEALFSDVLSHLTMEQPGFSEKLESLPVPHDLPALRRGLTSLSHEIVAMITQPGYLPLVRMIVAESSRFPQLGSLFFSTVTRRGLSLIIGLLEEARARKLIANLDVEVVAYTLLGGLLTSSILGLIFGGEGAPSMGSSRTDAVVELIIRALTPQAGDFL